MIELRYPQSFFLKFRGWKTKETNLVVSLCKFGIVNTPISTGLADVAKVRDRQCSAALGLPTRIRDEDCDIEILEPTDFEEEDQSYPKYLGVQKREHVLYAIQMAKLAMHRSSCHESKFEKLC